MIPSPWEFALLALAAYRLWRLIADDDITQADQASRLQSMASPTIC